jgi:AcrR family transcriptional regulator
MDNQTRSEISRRKALEAALAILGRDGVGGLTFDSLSRESGISKGGLLHQFHTRHGVLDALVDYQRLRFEQIAHDFMEKEGAKKTEPTLATLIATYREVIDQPHSVARAVLAALVENPGLNEESKAIEAAKMKALRGEAIDPELSQLRYFAVVGIAFQTLVGLSSLSESTRNGLFDRLLDDKHWQAMTLDAKSHSGRSAS